MCHVNRRCSGAKNRPHFRRLSFHLHSPSLTSSGLLVNIPETALVISVRRTEGDFFYSLVYYQTFRLFFDDSQTVPANVEHGAHRSTSRVLLMYNGTTFNNNRLWQNNILCIKKNRSSLAYIHWLICLYELEIYSKAHSNSLLPAQDSRVKRLALVFLCVRLACLYQSLMQIT